MSVQTITARFLLTLAALCALAAPTIGQAAGYPDKPIRIMVGFPPGTSTDIVARTIAEGLRKRFEQPVVVENRPGANGMLAAEHVARAQPDGYTVLFTNTSAITLNPLVYKDLRYDVHKDFTPVTTVISVPAVLLVSTSNARTGTVTTVKELAAAARSGAPLTYASLGVGNLFHLAGAELAIAGGFAATHVPYRAGLVSTALLGNEVDFSFDTLAAMPHIQSGKLRPLAVTSQKRWRDLPDTPTMEELGLPMLRYDLWTGVMVPAGTDPAIVDALYREITAAAAVPELRTRLRTIGEIFSLNPKVFTETIRREIGRNEAAVKRTGISPH